jgi:CO/xanthine dehydrogenase Mo-binding subunit
MSPVEMDLAQHPGTNDNRSEFKYCGQLSQPGRQSWDMGKGVAKFPRDMVKEGMYYARSLRCPYGRATVEVLDTTAAEQLEGVLAVIRWDDEDLQKYPNNWEALGWMPILSDKGEYEGDECGVVVVARTDELCRTALDLVEVKWTVLPHVLDPRVAAEAGSPLLFPDMNPTGNIGGFLWADANLWEEGNVVEGFKEADHILEYDYSWPNHTTFRATPPAYLAYWEPDPWGTADYGEVLYINGARVFGDDGFYGFARQTMGLDLDHVRSTTPYIGGCYCNYHNKRGICLAPYLSKRLGVPVRYVYSRRDEFDYCTPQNYFRQKIGFTAEGHLTAVQSHQVHQTGVRSTMSLRVGGPNIAVTFGASGFEVTNCENLYSTLEQTYTNGTCISSEPSAKEIDVVTVALQKIAETLDMDVADVYRLNMRENASLTMCLDAGIKEFGWAEKSHKPGTRTLPDGRLHGAAMRYGDQSNGAGDRYNITLALKEDGKVYLPFSEAVLGSYWAEMCQMVIAEEVGMKLEDVICYFSPHYPNWNPGSSSDHAKSSTYGAKEAALMLRERILNTGFARLGASGPSEVDIVDSMLVLKADPSQMTPLGALGHIAAFSDDLSPMQGKLPKTMSMAFCEVAVDPETGGVEVLDYLVAHDFGKLFRLSSGAGQIENMIAMLNGIAQGEVVVWDEDTGVLLNGNIIDYKVPTRLDVPPIETVPLESRLGVGAYGASGVAHAHLNRGLPLMAVANAIGAWPESVPLTPEKVLRALGKID